ncbi:helix-turn-helix domain-containing protein [Nocardioides sp.]|uniref:helix-turn-helix domain-containing protein n=1 Tax=Nocardioides sp. TaxID=35761 RepID=UPI0039E640C9
MAEDRVATNSPCTEHCASPAEVAKRLGMSRSTVLRRIANGDCAATKVGTHHRIPLAEFERYNHELMRRMAEASAPDIEAELFGE